VSKRPIPRPASLWQRHATAVLRVFRLALTELGSESSLPVKEEDLDAMLHSKIAEAFQRIPHAEKPRGFHVVPQAVNWSVHSDDLNAEWTGKKPDFKWRMHNDDPMATTEELTRDFDIESKRLGLPTSRTWVLTEKYVTNGIARFLSASHRYGNGVDSGAMIGYVQDSDPATILAEVNDHIAEAKHAIPPISFPEPESQPVMATQQKLTRSEVSPANFALHHLWVDLRRN